MKNHQQKSHTASTHQTVTEAIKVKTGNKTITIRTTEQKLSAHCGADDVLGVSASAEVSPGPCIGVATCAHESQCPQGHRDCSGVHRGDS
ncbi:MAG: hypothetical protein NTV93_10810, partial [Verrucomicrobia bacterium]|nr:hypothetical protein [Verrucomicrobiota bacterium]